MPIIKPATISYGALRAWRWCIAASTLIARIGPGILKALAATPMSSTSAILTAQARAGGSPTARAAAANRIAGAAGARPEQVRDARGAHVAERLTALGGETLTRQEPKRQLLHERFGSANETTRKEATRIWR